LQESSWIQNKVEEGNETMGDQSNWELQSADDVAQALDWLRRRMKGNGLVLVAVGLNSVCFSKEVGVSPDDAADLIEQQLPALRQGFERLKSQRVTRGYARRQDVEQGG
jgi:hypothetical protein